MIQKISIEEFEKAVRNPYNTSIANDLDEFIKSADPVCEVCTKGYKDAKSVVNAYYSAVKKLGYGIKVIQRDGRVFLAKKEA